MKTKLSLYCMLLYALIAHSGLSRFFVRDAVCQDTQISHMKIDSTCKVFSLDEDEFLAEEIRKPNQLNQQELKLYLCDYEKHLNESPQSDGHYYQVTFSNTSVTWSGYFLQENISGLGCNFKLWAASFGWSGFRAEIIIGNKTIASCYFYANSNTYCEKSIFIFSDTISAWAGDQIKLKISHTGGSTGGILWGDYQAVDSHILIPKKPAQISVIPNEIILSIKQGEILPNETIIVENTGQSNLTFSLGMESFEGSNAIRLDGEQDHILVPDHQSLDLNNYITCECWIKIQSPPRWSDRIIVKNWDTWDEQLDVYALCYNLGESGVLMKIIDENLQRKATISEPNMINQFQWHHLAGVNDGDSLYIYIDGIRTGAIDGPKTIKTTSGPLTIGGTNRSESTFESGFIDAFMDEVRIWNKARTQQEIIQNMYNELSGNEPGLIGYWKFNENTGKVAYDATPNHNNGTLKYDASFVQSTAPLLDWVSIEKSPLITLAAGQKKKIEIKFNNDKLTVSSNYRCNIVISSNDPANQVLKIPIYLFITDIDAKPPKPIPDNYLISQNYPNPFNPETTIKYQLPEPSEVTIQFFNITGQVVKTMLEERRPAGYHSILWDGKDDIGNHVSSGVYFYQLRARSSKENFIETKKMILVR